MAIETGNLDKNGDRLEVVITNFRRNPNLPNQPASVRSEQLFVAQMKSGSWRRVSSKTPNFHNFVGRLKPLGFSYSWSRENRAVGYSVSTPTQSASTSEAANKYRYTVGTFGTILRGNAPSSLSLNVDQDTIDRLAALATNKLLRKIKSGSINLGVTAAEHKKTAATIVDGLGRIGQAARDLRRGNLVGAAEAFGGMTSRGQRRRFSKAYARDAEQAVARTWLGLKYGWGPIVNDIYGAAEALSRRGQSSIFVTTKAREKLQQDYPNQSFITTANNGKLKTTVGYGGTRKTEVQYSCTYYRKSPGIKSLSEVGITNPALIAWELVPFSFVVDWALPIGNWMDTFDATLGLTFYSGYRTVFTQKALNAYRSIQGLDQYGVMQDLNQSGGNEYIGVDRVTLSSFPTPALPRFRNPGSVSNVTSALALLSSIFRR